MNKPSKKEIINSTKPLKKKVDLKINGRRVEYVVTRKGVGHLITKFGIFLLYNFHIDDKWEEYNVLIKSKIGKNFQPLFSNNVLHIRIDSGCLTGQVFDDKTCECKAQLFRSMKEISKLGEGIIISIPGQDGRGMGIPFKLATLSLQYCWGLNTVEAAKLIAKGGCIDKRDYFGAIAILKFFGVEDGTKIDLLTNNPSKITAFTQNKYFQVERKELVIKADEFTERHLLAKQKYLGHVGLVKENN
jgi:GTP cyclohydrolase II